jgi:hypothetical protein
MASAHNNEQEEQSQMSQSVEVDMEVYVGAHVQIRQWLTACGPRGANRALHRCPTDGSI